MNRLEHHSICCVCNVAWVHSLKLNDFLYSKRRFTSQRLQSEKEQNNQPIKSNQLEKSLHNTPFLLHHFWKEENLGCDVYLPLYSCLKDIYWTCVALFVDYSQQSQLPKQMMLINNNNNNNNNNSMVLICSRQSQKRYGLPILFPYIFFIKCTKEEINQNGQHPKKQLL